MKSNNQDKLNDFTVYCHEHPKERFWQALRNWSGYGFIYGCNTMIKKFSDLIGLEDTFYK